MFWKCWQGKTVAEKFKRSVHTQVSLNIPSNVYEKPVMVNDICKDDYCEYRKAEPGHYEASFN